jgi:hypothetical protein
MMHQVAGVAPEGMQQGAPTTCTGNSPQCLVCTDSTLPGPGPAARRPRGGRREHLALLRSAGPRRPHRTLAQAPHLVRTRPQTLLQ